MKPQVIKAFQILIAINLASLRASRNVVRHSESLVPECNEWESQRRNEVPKGIANPGKHFIHIYYVLLDPSAAPQDDDSFFFSSLKSQILTLNSLPMSFRQRKESQRADLFNRHSALNNGNTLLEIGTGDGLFASHLQKAYGYKIIGYDIQHLLSPQASISNYYV